MAANVRHVTRADSLTPAIMSAAPDPVADAKSRIREISPDDVRAMQARDEPVTLIDVREPNEWAMGRIPGAIPIARGALQSSVEAQVPRSARVVVYCALGGRSALAADTLQNMGYTDVASMRGGIHAWTDAGGEIGE